MTEKELKIMKDSVVERLSEYCSCGKQSVLKLMEIIEPCFSCEGAMIYHLSDNLNYQQIKN